MTDLLIIALGNVNFSKGRKVLRPYWMSIVGGCLIFLSALNPPPYSPFDYNGIQAVRFHARHCVNTEEVKVPAFSISQNKEKVSGKEGGKKRKSGDERKKGIKQVLCCFSVDKCADLQELWEGHFTALWFFIQAFQTAVITTELQQIPDLAI